MTPTAPRTARNVRSVVTFLILAAASVQYLAAQSQEPKSIIRLGLVGGSRVEAINGAALAAGGMIRKGAFSITALGEGLFYNGRPDARFQETPVSVVYPDAPLVETEEILCEDADTDEVFARGKCQIGKAMLSGMVDIGVRAPLGNNELTLGVGYRVGSQTAPYALLGISGALNGQASGWIARLTVSRRAMGLKVGYAMG